MRRPIRAIGLRLNRRARRCGLETRPTQAHIEEMQELSALTIHVTPDGDRPGRYRWNIHEGGKARDKSVYSFATKREAQADAEKFVDKLIVTWKR